VTAWAQVEDVDPIASCYGTVSPRMRDGTVFLPDQRLTRAEALKTYTVKGDFDGARSTRSSAA